MSLKENLDDFVYSTRESYYNLEDRIGFPPILILGVVILLVIGAFYFLGVEPDPPVPDKVTATFIFKDAQGRFIKSINVKLAVNGDPLFKKSDSDGQISFELKKNSEIDITVSDDDYEAFTGSFEVKESNLKEVILLKLTAVQLKTKMLRFEDEKGLITGKTITATVICINGQSFTVTDQDQDGKIEVTLPEGCDDIKVNAEIEGYDEASTEYFGSADSKVIIFKKKEIPKGSLRLRLVDEEGKSLTVPNKDFKVTIKTADEERIEKTSQGYAIVPFNNIPAGNYSVKLIDEESDYVVVNLAELALVEVPKNETAEQEVVLSRAVKGKITVKVRDVDSNEAIEGAFVELEDAEGNPVAELETGASGNVEFSLFDEGAYVAKAKKEGGIGEGYFPGSAEVAALDLDVTIELKKITEAELGRTLVVVKDEDGVPVRNAKVMFRSKDTGAIVPLNSIENYVLSNEDGNAEFYLGSLEGDIYPYAVKYPAEGGTDALARSIDPLTLNRFDVTLIIGNSSLELRTINSSGSILTETVFEIFDQSGETVTNGKVPMASGEMSYELKADKVVYVVFSKEGYMEFQSETIPLWPNESFDVTALMRQDGEILEPSVEFKGAYRNNLLAESLKAGERYEFKFTLVYPNNSELDAAGFHFRVGDRESLEDEDLYITIVNASNSDSIKSGLTYVPTDNEATESAAGTKAKWASVEWENPESGIYNLSVEVKIKDLALPNTKLPIYYRAWSRKDSEFVRTPVDEVLGLDGNAEGFDGLYAETFSQFYFEGSKPFCETEFCVMSDWLYDAQEDIFLKKPYSMAIMGDYNFIFTVLNNSTESYNNTRLVLKNALSGTEKQDLKIKKSILYDADDVLTIETPDSYEIEVNPLANFTYSKDINFNLNVLPRNAADTQFQLQIIGDQQIVFEHEFDFRIGAQDSMQLEISPSEIDPFTETELSVTAMNSGEPVRDALIRLTRESPDGLYQVETEKTNNDGEVFFSVPASLPLTKIKIEAEKIGFLPKEKEITVGNNTIEFAPEILYSSLNTTSKKEETLAFTLKNNSGAEFKIKSASLTGNFKGIINEEALASYLSTWNNAPIPANSDQELALPKIVLSLNAEDYMDGHETLQGELELMLSLPAFFSEYSIVVPVNIDISMGGLPDNSPCINIEGVSVPDWEATILNNRAVTEFEIYNSCVKDGQKIDVENLQATLEWNSASKKAGILELTIFNPDGSAVSDVLRDRDSVVFWNEMKRDSFGTYHAVLSYTPKSGYLNETGEFTIKFDAEIDTDAGKQKVNEGAPGLSGSILNLNLDDCISMPGAGEKVVLAAGEEEISFTIDAAECNSNVSISLCTGDPRCKGGTTEGGITVTPMEFDLQESSSEQTITVYREQVPGLYGIPVYAKLPNTSFQKVRTIDLLIEPKAEKWLSLNRYEAILSQETNWKDTVELSNRAPLETVAITATLCLSCKKPNKLPDECVWNKANEMETAQKDLFDFDKALTWGLSLGGFCALQASAAGQAAVAESEVVANQAMTNYYNELAATAATAPKIEIVDESVMFFGNPEFPLDPSKRSEKEFGETAEFVADPLSWGIACFAAGFIARVVWDAFGPACDKQDETMPLQDYILNIEQDPSKSISLEEDTFKADWGEINNPQGETATETIPIDLENIAEEAGVEPTYEVLTVTTTEHIHGDPAHINPEMHMDEANFSQYNIPDTDTREHKQKFHMKLETKKSIDLELPPLDDFYSCVDGAKIGITGKDAKPRIALNWDWGPGGIEIADCDSGNYQGVYCDATQFSIAMSKKIHRIEEFMAANDYYFECPSNPRTHFTSSVVDNINATQSAHEVQTDRIGLKKIVTATSSTGNEIEISVLAENNTGSEASAKIAIGLSGPSNYFDECEETVTIEASGEKTVECTFTALEKSDESPYVATAFIEESSSIDVVDPIRLKSALFITELDHGGCWAPYSTQKYNGRPSIEYFFNKSIPNWESYVNEDSVNWPAGWPGQSEEEKIEYLRSLFQFKANLIQDGYGVDFQKDFANYYSGPTFFEVPSWFYSASGESLADYFSDTERLKFKQKYSSEAILPGPGEYEVYITIDFGDDWKLYHDSEPDGKITVEFYKVNAPIVNSVFYYLPFDGMVGLESVNGRQDYGSNYVNENEEILVKQAPYEMRTAQATGSNALMTVHTAFQQDLKQLNSSASTRGNILSIEASGNEPVLVFSPSYATPVIMNIEKEDGGTFNSSFTFLENETPVLTGNNLSFWTGLGQCADFSGQPIREVFDFYADSRNEQYSYHIPVDTFTYNGNVYLHSVFYTPITKNYLIRSDSGNVKFASPDATESGSVEVTGIGPMENNSRANGSIASVEKVLEMVEDNTVCVTNSGTKSSFWWNPKALKDFKGAALSVTEFEQTLIPGNTCIGS